MCWFRTSALLLLTSPVWAVEGYIVGAGVGSDSADGLSGTVVGEIGLSKKTWVSGSYAKNSVDLPRGTSLDTAYADLGLDHWFDPVGVRLSVAFWGDDEILNSDDIRGAVYWRNKKVSLSGNVEFRDFDFDIPRTILFPGRNIRFDATGVGATAQFAINDTVSLDISATDYDYSVRLGRAENRGIRELLSSSRLSIINSLVDYRGRIGLGFDVGAQRWDFDYSRSKGAVDGSTTQSATARFLTPLGKSSDVEFSIGIDNSDLYDTVTFFSVFVYFYGGR